MARNDIINTAIMNNPEFCNEENKELEYDNSRFVKIDEIEINGKYYEVEFDTSAYIELCK